MRRVQSYSGRGQTEPLGALVAVAVVCLAIGLYAGHVANVLPGQSDRAVEETVLDSVWHDLGTGGVYDATDTSPRYEVSTSALPDGYHVFVELSAVGTDGRTDVHGTAQFGPDGALVTADPPTDAGSASRPVPVVVEPGTVRRGSLRVVVWR